jgi:hypothetical protein
LKNAVKLLAMPIVLPVFFVGWILNIFGDKHIWRIRFESKSEVTFLEAVAELAYAVA